MADLNDGRQMYNITIDKKVVEYAYKPEIFNYLKTGEFVYDEQLTIKKRKDDKR